MAASGGDPSAAEFGNLGYDERTVVVASDLWAAADPRKAWTLVTSHAPGGVCAEEQRRSTSTGGRAVRPLQRMARARDADVQHGRRAARPGDGVAPARVACGGGGIRTSAASSTRGVHAHRGVNARRGSKARPAPTPGPPEPPAPTPTHLLEERAWVVGGGFVQSALHAESVESTVASFRAGAGGLGAVSNSTNSTDSPVHATWTNCTTNPGFDGRIFHTVEALTSTPTARPPAADTPNRDKLDETAARGL